MNAKEANEIANRINSTAGIAEKIKQMITEAANVGKFSIMYRGELPEDVKTELERAGYTVEKKDYSATEKVITIQWSEVTDILTDNF